MPEARVLWACYLLEEIGYPQPEATRIYEDNAAVVRPTESPASPTGRSKHINKLHRTAQQYVDRREVVNRAITGAK